MQKGYSELAKALTDAWCFARFWSPGWPMYLIIETFGL